MYGSWYSKGNLCECIFRTLVLTPILLKGADNYVADTLYAPMQTQDTFQLTQKSWIHRMFRERLH